MQKSVSIIPIREGRIAGLAIIAEGDSGFDFQNPGLVISAFIVFVTETILEKVQSVICFNILLCNMCKFHARIGCFLISVPFLEDSDKNSSLHAILDQYCVRYFRNLYKYRGF